MHPLDPHSTHLTPSVHENWPFEVLNLDSLHDLPVKGLLERSGDSHTILDPLAPLVMMDTMEPEHLRGITLRISLINLPVGMYQEIHP